jgi:two-component system, chemotaxis family, chemotaxis protein CheY
MAPRPDVRGFSPLVLVVDDDYDIRELIAEALVLDGYRVRTARNGKVALEQAWVDPPDLIVLDLMMPVMNGWQFLEALRGVPRLATIPVIVVSASIVSQVEGAALLLQKPFDLDTLLMAAARLCERETGHIVSVSDQLSA